MNNLMLILIIFLLLVNNTNCQNCLLIPKDCIEQIDDNKIKKEILDFLPHNICSDSSSKYAFEFYFLSGGKNIFITLFWVDGMGNFRLDYYKNSLLVFSKNGKLTLKPNSSIFGGNWECICPFGQNSHNFQLLYTKTPEKILNIKSDCGQIFETLNKHKDFFEEIIDIHIVTEKIINQQIKHINNK